MLVVTALLVYLAMPDQFRASVGTAQPLVSSQQAQLDVLPQVRSDSTSAVVLSDEVATPPRPASQAPPISERDSEALSSPGSLPSCAGFLASLRSADREPAPSSSTERAAEPPLLTRLSDSVGGAAESFPEAGEGFAYYTERVCELQATDPAVADVVSGRFPASECLMAICSRTKDAATQIVGRAQAAGAVRPDFTGEDLLLFFGTNALLARAVADTAPDTWRRQVAFLLTGLSTNPAQDPLTVAPLTPPQMYEVMGRLAGTP
ncbi:hypothetical protein [Streptomyces albidoflavus]|uniref:SbtR family transcriptional regulator n=1 Tax=Streptomyces albidoflavus TaxID=1886 RepID=UPI00332DF46F